MTGPRGGGRHGMVADPVTRIPARVPGAVRRTVGLDMVREDGGWLVVRSVARDVHTHTDGAPTVRTARVRARAEVADGMRVAELAADPAHAALAALVGTRAAGGFRAAAAAALGPGEAGGPLAALLDDLPVAALISGYGQALAAAEGDPAAAAASPERMAKRDICSGWRSGGVMMSALDRAREIPLRRGPVAPRIEAGPGRADPEGWHAEAPPAPGAMRRRRRVDLLPARPDGTTDLDAMFRDTYVGRDGVETVVHEYSLRALLGPDDHGPVVREITAEPRVLPWPECPVAAASAQRLVGLPVTELSRWVRRELTGTSTCTHLNDLLRSMAGVPAMLRWAGR